MKFTNTINKGNVISFSGAMERKQDAPLTALLKEISSALHSLLSNGNETIIDLNNTPCDQECEVWWVYHKNDTGAVLTKALYISFVPSILPAQREDVEYGTTVLDRRLAKLDD